MRTRNADGPRSAMVELHRLGGTVSDADARPVAGAWVVLPDFGLWAATDNRGRFLLNRIAPGTHRAVVRTRTGEEAELKIAVPGDRVDVIIGRKPQPARRSSRPKG
jgi:hypothetical protein